MPKERLMRTPHGIDIDALTRHFLREGRLALSDAVNIVKMATEHFLEEPNLLELPEPITIVGDIHGQFYDLVKLVELSGPLATSAYLFLGDYVDRGYFGCECILLLLAAKVTAPDSVWMLRGNHESRHMSTSFNFKSECMRKYNEELYDLLMVCFDALPLAAMVSQKYFCVHGGLSPDITYVSDVACIPRFREVPNAGAMCDLLWSDPHYDCDNPVGEDGDAYSAAYAPYDTTINFMKNEQRGCSYIFNFAALKHFIDKNKLLCVIRAHEMQQEGFRLHRLHPVSNFPSMISLFSAPNYCDSYDNKGAVMCIQSGRINLVQFFSSPHPYVLPNFMNAFEWSLGFLQEKALSVVAALLNVTGKPGLPHPHERFELNSDDEADIQQISRQMVSAT
jgi:serine/threonine-protein phosphatase 2B catalytic subunit